MNTLKINSITPRFLTKRHKLPKEVLIPRYLDMKVYDKLLNMQGSLDYMANRFGINFEFNDKPLDCAASVVCKKGSRINESSNINATDDDVTVAKKINRAVSRLLLSEKKSNVKEDFHIPKGLSDELKDKLMNHKGTLDYYKKRYGVDYRISYGDSFLFIDCYKGDQDSYTVVDEADSEKTAFLKIKKIVDEVK